MSLVFPLSSQAQVLEAYTVLHTLRSSWRGSMILNVSLDARGTALSLASSVAGAVCLTLEPESEVLRAALRRNACDFVVNTLDEALRAIKNEIRQSKPLAVGLHGYPKSLLDEIVERGVAPALFAAAERYPEHAARLTAFGAQLLSLDQATGSPTAKEVLRSADLPWALESFVFAGSAELRAFEARALSMLSSAETLRRQWLLTAGRLFPRERTRTLWLTAEESTELRGAYQPVRDVTPTE